MTEKQLTKRVQRWQDVLLPLGLAQWRIEVKIVDVPFGTMHNCDAAIQSADDYDHAIMHVKREALDRLSDRGLDEVVVHELMHVAMRDLDLAIHSVDDHLMPAVEDQWRMRVKHEREGLVERLALTIVAAHTDYE